MLKLLTDEEREKILSEYARRRIIVVLGALMLVLVIGVVGLLPSYILSSIRLAEAHERLEILARSGEQAEGVGAEAWLKEINRRLDVLSPHLDKDKPTETINQILGELSDGISITTFSKSLNKNRVTMYVNGLATDRQTLIDFRDRVAELKIFSEVTLPISNLAQDREINFQMELVPAQARRSTSVEVPTEAPTETPSETQ